MNRLGQKLVETQIGGTEGGGATLTPLAQAYIEKFNQFQEETQTLLQNQYKKAFPDQSWTQTVQTSLLLCPASFAAFASLR